LVLLVLSSFLIFFFVIGVALASRPYEIEPFFRFCRSFVLHLARDLPSAGVFAVVFPTVRGGEGFVERRSFCRFAFSSPPCSLSMILSFCLSFLFFSGLP